MRYDLFRAFQEIAWPCGARIFGFWRGFGEGACPQRPDCFARSARHLWATDWQGLGSQTEPKRSQNPKKTALAERLWYFLNRSNAALPRRLKKRVRPVAPLGAFTLIELLVVIAIIAILA